MTHTITRAVAKRPAGLGHRYRATCACGHGTPWLDSREQREEEIATHLWEIRQREIAKEGRREYGSALNGIASRRARADQAARKSSTTKKDQT